MSKEQITGLFINMIVLDLRPISICEDPGFNYLIMNAFPHFNMPSRATLTRRIEALYKSKKLAFMEDLADAKYVAITSDGYTQKYTQKGFDTTTVHYAKNGELKRGVLDTSEFKEISHTGLAIKATIKKTCDNFKITSIIYMKFIIHF